MVYVVAFEIVQDRHSYGAVGKTRQRGYRPLGRVAATQRHFVAALHSRLFEKQVEFGYLAGHVAVLERYSVEVGQCQFLPVVADGVLYILVKMLMLFHS